MIFDFVSLIERYEVGVPYTVEAAGYRDPATGRWVEGIPSTTIERMAVLPADKQAVYESGGRITSANRIIYRRGTPLDARGSIQFEGASWTIEVYGDYTTYSNFYRYVATREVKA